MLLKLGKIRPSVLFFCIAILSIIRIQKKNRLTSVDKAELLSKKNTKIILYDCFDIYKILNELNEFLKFDLVNITNQNSLTSYIKNIDLYLIIQKRKELDDKNLIVLEQLPIKIEKLVEKINLGILKNNFNSKSNIKIDKYSLNINSREIYCENKKVKLTEQEVKILMYLVKFKVPVKVDNLEKDIWGYNENLETHILYMPYSSYK